MNKANLNIITAYQNGYRVSSDGTLLGVDGKDIKYAFSEKLRYPRFSIWIGKENSKDGYAKVPVHRFAAYCFYGEELFNHALVRHLNGNVKNFSRENIALGGAFENSMDRAKSSRSESSVKAAVTRRSNGYVAESKRRVCRISICPACGKYFDVTRLSKARIAKKPCCSRPCAARNRALESVAIDS